MNAFRQTKKIVSKNTERAFQAFVPIVGQIDFALTKIPFIKDIYRTARHTILYCSLIFCCIVTIICYLILTTVFNIFKSGTIDFGAAIDYATDVNCLSTTSDVISRNLEFDTAGDLTECAIQQGEQIQQRNPVEDV